MSELTAGEFVAEQIMHLEERLEGALADAERWQIENALGQAIRRLEGEERAVTIALADHAASTQPVVDLEKLREKVRAELHGESDEDGSLAGPLGEAIADAAGSYSLEFCSPESVARGIRAWLASLSDPKEKGTEG
jgi:hypothetical protein